MRRFLLAVACVMIVGSISYADGSRVPSYVIEALSRLDGAAPTVRRAGTQAQGSGPFSVLLWPAEGTTTGPGTTTGRPEDGTTTTTHTGGDLEYPETCENCGMAGGVNDDGTCTICEEERDPLCEHCGMVSETHEGPCSVCEEPLSCESGHCGPETCESCGMEGGVTDDGACTICGEPTDPGTITATDTDLQYPDTCEHCGMAEGADDSGDCTVCGEAMKYDPAENPEVFTGPSGTSSAPSDLEVFIESKGESTGEVFVAYFLNNGKTAIEVDSEGTVLEPVENPDPATVARMEQIKALVSSGKPPTTGGPSAPLDLRRLYGATPFHLSWISETTPPNMARIELDGYCLDKELAPPTEGMLFRLVPAEEQRSRGGYRAILRASQSLRDADRLNPDSDPQAYFHSIRQWAIWVQEEGMTRDEFEVAFVDYVREGIEAAGNEWDEETAEIVRSFVPNRWNDVTTILTEAGSTS